MHRAYMNKQSQAVVLFIMAVALAALGERREALAQGAKKSDAVVKIDAATDAPSADGKQTVTFHLTIEKPWHLYANPTPKDFPGIPVTITIDAKNKPQAVKLDYPEGKLVKDDIVGDYKVYEGKVSIKASVQRGKGEAGPLDVSIKLQACTDKQCLLPATVKMTVPPAK